MNVTLHGKEEHICKGNKVAIEVKLFTIILDYPGKHNITTSVLQSQRGRKKTIRGRQDYGRNIRQMLISEKKQATSQRMQTLENGKGKKIDSLPQLPGDIALLILAQACLSQTSRSLK